MSKRTTKSKKLGQCAFCWRPAVTEDHIPPKGLFAKKHRKDVIKVPACEECNRATHLDDEYMKRLALAAGADQSADAIEVRESVFRSLEYEEKNGMRIRGS